MLLLLYLSIRLSAPLSSSIHYYICLFIRNLLLLFVCCLLIVMQVFQIQIQIQIQRYKIYNRTNTFSTKLSSKWRFPLRYICIFRYFRHLKRSNCAAVTFTGRTNTFLCITLCHLLHNIGSHLSSFLQQVRIYLLYTFTYLKGTKPFSLHLSAI